MTYSTTVIDESPPPVRQSWWRSRMPRSWRQFQVKSLTTSFWWLRTWHPWSGLALIVLFWCLQRDRRLAHQVRLQHLFFKQVNFRDIELMLGDFIRPELWLL
jgi:hypothetical protein